jgi:hypothetical protein
VEKNKKFSLKNKMGKIASAASEKSLFFGEKIPAVPFVEPLRGFSGDREFAVCLFCARLVRG